MCKSTKAKSIISILLSVALMSACYAVGSYQGIDKAYAAVVNGPSIEGNQTGIAIGNDMAVVKRGTYIINLKSANVQNGGKGQSVDFKINLNVGDVIHLDQVSGTKQSGGNGLKGQDGAAGLTIKLNGSFLASVQGGSGNGGDGYPDASGKPNYYHEGGNGGKGGVTEEGNCLSSSGGGGSGGVYNSGNGKPGSDGVGIYASDAIMSHTRLGVYEGSTLCTVIFERAYSNNVTGWEITPNSFVAPFGYTAGQIVSDILPKQIQMKTTLKTYTVNVSNWTCTYFKQNQGGDYYFEANITYPEDSTNTAGIKPQVIVTVKVPGDSEYNYLGQTEIAKSIDRFTEAFAKKESGGDSGIPTQPKSAVVAVVIGKSFDIYIPIESNKAGTTVSGSITIINNDVQDGLLQLVGRVDTAGNKEITVGATKFVVQTVEEPDSTNVKAILN